MFQQRRMHLVDRLKRRKEVNSPADVNDIVVNLVDVELTTQQIQDKIAQLSVTEEGESLKGAMDDLKKALKANPAACAALLPQDIGEMVKYLMLLTGKDIEETMANKGTRKKKDKIDVSKMTEAQQQEILDDLM